tara:strand:- start:10078 stop:11724 length:1647 start_codon:yes stop_codon:yes gene_type:complete
MTFIPMKIIGSCIADDETLFCNMEAAIARGLPEVLKQTPAHDMPIALIGSAPSVKGQLEIIKKMRQAGTKLVAIKDAHDWLIEQGVVPDYALAIDPQEHRWNCFKRKNARVNYMIASQCHAAMFDHLRGLNVTIWHPYVMKEQKRPRNRMLVGGGTTSGLRAISLFYVLGYRHFALFGFDSCCDNGVLRVNGDLPKAGDELNEVRIERDGETFYCTPSMALQAEHFQDYYDWIPDAHFYGYGHGLIQTIIKKRAENATELQAIHDAPPAANGRVSFIHWGSDKDASYRYRARTPAQELGASLNDFTADTLVFSKPQADELMKMARAKARGAWVVVDFCDDHFDWVHYKDALKLADAVTCPTQAMADRIKELGRDASVIPDPYEYTHMLPHCNGINLLWYGHGVNRASLQRILPDIDGYPLRVVSNFGGTIPWSHETMLREFAMADMVLIPFTEKYKSNNRTLEAIMQGCFVVAEPHPALEGIPGIWIGNIKEGIEWTRQNLAAARLKTSEAQKYVMDEYSPKTLGAMWRKAIQRPTTSAVAPKNGTDG